jgi:hypothetical protein
MKSGISVVLVDNGKHGIFGPTSQDLDEILVDFHRFLTTMPRTMRLPPQSPRGGQDATLPTNPTPIIKSPDLGKTHCPSENLPAGSSTQIAFGY